MGQITQKGDKVKIGLFIVVAIGGFIRFWGIGFGLPHLYHPDEFALVSPALNILQTGDLNPHRFDYGSLYIYLQSIVFGLYFVYGRSRGLFTSIHDIPVYEFPRDIYAYDYPGVYVAGRLFTALLGTLTIVLVYHIGRRLKNRQLGFIAALFLAFFPLHVVDSHFITTDVPATFFMTASLLFALRIMDNGETREYIIAGLLAGLAASIKYPGGTIIVTLISAHILRQRQGLEVRKLFIGLAASAIGFLMTTPFALLDLPEWLYWLNYVRNVYNPQVTLVEDISALWYLDFLLQFPIILITLPGLIGFIWVIWDGWRKEQRKGWIIGIFLLLFFTSISLQKVHHARALIPLLPSLTLLAGYFVFKITISIRQRGWLKQLQKEQLATVLAMLLVTIPLLTSISHSYRLTQKSARTLMREWIEENLPPGSKIATDFASPVLPSDQFEVNRIGWTILNHDLAWYQQEQFDYLVIAETTRYSPNRTVDQEAQYQSFLGSGTLSLVTEIEGHLLSYPGYHFWLYEFQE